MIVICKRFAMDDVPVKLVKTWEEAQRYCKKKHAKYATIHEQDIAQIDIGTGAEWYLVVEFNKLGVPIKSKILPLNQFFP